MGRDCRKYGVIGIGIGGDESSEPTAAFAGAFREARRLGLHTVAHAGEFEGPRSIWEAIDILEVERVGHGIRAVEDAELVKALVRRGIPLECCPTSNVRTGIVDAWEDHPIKVLHAAGVVVTVSSDDPALFSTSAAGEWRALEERIGLGRRDVLRIGLRTVGAAFADTVEKDRLAEAMTEAAGRFGVEV
jgi:adenosine deaminase